MGILTGKLSLKTEKWFSWTTIFEFFDFCPANSTERHSISRVLGNYWHKTNIWQFKWFLKRKYTSSLCVCMCVLFFNILLHIRLQKQWSCKKRDLHWKWCAPLKYKIKCTSQQSWDLKNWSFSSLTFHLSSFQLGLICWSQTRIYCQDPVRILWKDKNPQLRF